VLRGLAQADVSDVRSPEAGRQWAGLGHADARCAPRRHRLGLVTRAAAIELVPAGCGSGRRVA